MRSLLAPALGAFMTITTSTQVFAAYNTAKTYEKDVSQYCPKDLNQVEKHKRYSRIANIGASFSHGCTQCEVLGPMRDAFTRSGDNIWLRRNYLLHF